MTAKNIYQPCEHVTVYLTKDAQPVDVPPRTGSSAEIIESLQDPKGQNVRYQFDIPPKYFSNDRGSFCTIQCVGGSHSLGTQNGIAVVLQLENLPMSNSFTVTDGILVVNLNSLGAPINEEDIKPLPTGVLAYGLEFAPSGGGKLLPAGEIIVPCRPQKLHFKLTYVAGQPVTGANTSSVINQPNELAGTVTLKFTYYDAIQSVTNSKNNLNYKTL